jgi:hypothetical protein
MNIVETVIFALSFLALSVGVYYAYAFQRLWREHMRSIGLRESTIWRLSPFAIFWRGLPEHFNIQRRKFLLAVVAYLLLLGLGAIWIGVEKSSWFQKLVE